MSLLFWCVTETEFESRSRFHLMRATNFIHTWMTCSSSLHGNFLLSSLVSAERFNFRTLPFASFFRTIPRAVHLTTQPGSLVLLLEKELRFSNAQADTQFALWSGVCYVMPLFGGWVADRFLGECRIARTPSATANTRVRMQHAMVAAVEQRLNICRICPRASVSTDVF